jgi:hypothetical protein
VQANTTADAIINQGGRHESVFELKDRNRSTNLAGGAPICGTVKVAEYHAQAVDDATAQAAEQVRQQVSEVKKRAVVQMMNDLDGWVNTWPRSVSEATWDTVNSARFNEIVGQYEAQIVSDLSGLSSGANATLNVGERLLKLDRRGMGERRGLVPARRAGPVPALDHLLRAAGQRRGTCIDRASEATRHRESSCRASRWLGTSRASRRRTTTTRPPKCSRKTLHR